MVQFPVRVLLIMTLTKRVKVCLCLCFLHLWLNHPFVVLAKLHVYLIFSADGYSIYLKGLPMNATEALLDEVFNKFGTIKNDGIQVRSNRVGSNIPILIN